MNHIIFVYGSLKKGGRWHTLLKNARCLEHSDSITGTMYLHPNLYPILFEGTDKIQGEVYEVSEKDMEKIRIIEFEYVVKKIITAKGYVAEVFYFKDSSAKEYMKRISSFNSEKYFAKWLEQNPPGTKEYIRYLELGGSFEILNN